jgi:hypothetical protein
MCTLLRGVASWSAQYAVDRRAMPRRHVMTGRRGPRGTYRRGNPGQHAGLTRYNARRDPVFRRTDVGSTTPAAGRRGTMSGSGAP